MTMKVSEITASDVSGQKRVSLRDVAGDSTVGDLLERVRASLGLHLADSEGRPTPIEGRLEREGRHLHSSEMVGDALEAKDHIVIHPRIMAG